MHRLLSKSELSHALPHSFHEVLQNNNKKENYLLKLYKTFFRDARARIRFFLYSILCYCILKKTPRKRNETEKVDKREKEIFKKILIVYTEFFSTVGGDIFVYLRRHRAGIECCGKVHAQVHAISIQCTQACNSTMRKDLVLRSATTLRVSAPETTASLVQEC